MASVGARPGVRVGDRWVVGLGLGLVSGGARVWARAGAWVLVLVGARVGVWAGVGV